MEPLSVGLGGFYLSGFIYTTFEAGCTAIGLLLPDFRYDALLPGLPGRPPVRILKVVMQFIYSSVSEEESGAVGNNQTQFQEKKICLFPGPLYMNDHVQFHLLILTALLRFLT